MIGALAGVPVVGLALVKNAVAASGSAEPILVTSLASLEEGSVVEFEFPQGHAAIAVALAGPAQGGVGPGQNIVAFHRACPHMGCPIATIDATSGRLGPCGCHRSVFDLKNAGRQIYGMASQNLVQVELQVRGQDIYAVGCVGLPYGEPLTEEHL